VGWIVSGTAPRLWISACPSRPNFRRECPEATQFRSIALGQRTFDLIKNGINNLLCVRYVQMQIIPGNALH
jgi:hypothetical protein